MLNPLSFGVGGNRRNRRRLHSERGSRLTLGRCTGRKEQDGTAHKQAVPHHLNPYHMSPAAFRSVEHPAVARDEESAQVVPPSHGYPDRASSICGKKKAISPTAVSAESDPCTALYSMLVP